MPRKIKEQPPIDDSARAATATMDQPAPAVSSDDRLAHLEAENQKLHAAIREMLARDEARQVAEAKRIADAEAAEKARIAAIPEPEWQIEVVAYNQGTYPEPGAMHAWLRNPGDRFRIKNKDHFRQEWMMKPGDAPPDLKSDIAGHGPGFIPGVGIPLTGVANQVNDPLMQLNNATRAAMAR